jgi:hypothetical protein
MGGPLGSYRVVDVIGIPNWWKHMGIGPEHEPFMRCLDHHGRKKEDLAYHGAHTAPRASRPDGQRDNEGSHERGSRHSCQHSPLIAYCLALILPTSGVDMDDQNKERSVAVTGLTNASSSAKSVKRSVLAPGASECREEYMTKPYELS